MLNVEKIIDALKHQKASELFSLLQECEIDDDVLKMILLDVTLPIMEEINGVKAEQGQIFLEHHLSEMLMILYVAVKEKLKRNEEQDVMSPILLLCPEGERHDIGLRWIELVLMHKGYSVYYSGPDMPNSQIPIILNSLRPACVIISITNFYNLLKAKTTCKMITDVLPEVKIYIGGKAIENNPEYFEKGIGVMSMSDLLQKLGVTL